MISFVMAGFSVPRNLSTDDDKKRAIILLLQRRMEHLVQSGSVAYAVAFSQVEFMN